ncbi:hypothetical protein N0V88_005596 [Collariella sp. IMI 366227]|nr:hypothetical protein N0V88_005596 [Collariella sp. IMI 366227]
MSLHAWVILSASLRRETRQGYGERKEQQLESKLLMAIHRYREELRNPPCELSIYTTPLGQLDEGCLTYLFINNVSHFRAHELLTLARLPRLAVLELNERNLETDVVTDRLIRGWGEVDEALEIFDVAQLSGRREAAAIAEVYGWKATKPKGSIFRVYAEAYLDGFPVQTKNADKLWSLYNNNQTQVYLGEDPRRRAAADEEAGSDGSHLEDGWRQLLKGEHLLSAAQDPQLQEERSRYGLLSDNDVFWFLGLLDQKERACATDGIGERMEGITLPKHRIVNLRLHGASTSTSTAERQLDSVRLIFSRTSKPKEAKTAPPAPAPRRQGLEDRKQTGLQARKRQKLGDIFSSMGMDPAW